MAVITLEQVRAWNPCSDYTDERLEELAAGRESITIAEALDLPISASHRVWLLTNQGVLPDTVRREWVEAVVSRAVRAHALTCGIAEVEDWAARWFAGDPAARTRAAWAAEAAEALAWAADVWDVAAKEAARAGARPLAWNAAWEVERERQIADLRAILATQEKETDRDSDHS